MKKRSRLVLPPSEYKTLCQRKVFARDKLRCRVCSQRKALHAHHVIFRSHGGDDVSHNLLSVCSNCHVAVHAYQCMIVARSGDPNDEVNCDEGVRIVIVNKDWIPGRPLKGKKNG